MKKAEILYNIEGCIQYNDIRSVIKWIDRARKGLSLSEFDEIVVEVLNLTRETKIESAIYEQIREDLGRIKKARLKEKREKERAEEKAKEEWKARMAIVKRFEEKKRENVKKLREEGRKKRLAKEKEEITRIKKLFTSKGIHCFYHFTDVDNLPLIRTYGILSCKELLRREIKPPKPGGNNWSREADEIKGLDEYVHLCFKDQHPMEYIARNDGRIDNTRFLKISLDVLYCGGVMGSKDVANKASAEVLPIGLAVNEFDLDVLFEDIVDFHNPDQRNRYNEAKKSEILIPSSIPPHLIENLY